MGLIKQVNVDECDEYGYSGLHMAAENGHLAIVEALLEAGAKINCLIFDSCLTPLHLALSKNKMDVAKKLINAGANLDLVSQIGVCGPALHYAIIKEDTEIVKMMIAKGADVNVQEENSGYSPLYLASTLDQIETMKLLLATGADVNLVDYDDKAPLHFAAANGNGDIVKLLVDNKADVSLQDGEGETAEAKADRGKEAEIVAFLAAAATGKIPAKAPAGKVKEVREFRTIIPLEGCGEGRAPPE